MSQPDVDAPGTGAAPALRLSALTRRFGRSWALRGVDLEVERGTVLALTGPNGAGKSTLLRIVATLLGPTAGRAEILGFDPAEDTDAIRRRTGLLAAEDFLYAELTARENLRFASLMAGTRPGGRTSTADDRGDRVEEALARVGLDSAGDLRVRGFSSGMRRRLALARLLLRPLELILLDEPYASLDAAGVELVDGIVGKMREAGRTVVLASHQWGRSIRTADRVAVLERGRVVWTGPPDEHAARRTAADAGGAPTPAPAGPSPTEPADPDRAGEGGG